MPPSPSSEKVDLDEVACRRVWCGGLGVVVRWEAVSEIPSAVLDERGGDRGDLACPRLAQGLGRFGAQPQALGELGALGLDQGRPVHRLIAFDHQSATRQETVEIGGAGLHRCRMAQVLVVSAGDRGDRAGPPPRRKGGRDIGDVDAAGGRARRGGRCRRPPGRSGGRERDRRTGC